MPMAIAERRDTRMALIGSERDASITKNEAQCGEISRLRSHFGSPLVLFVCVILRVYLAT